MNPGAADAAAARGTWIHEATENHIRGLKVVREKHTPHVYTNSTTRQRHSALVGALCRVEG